jgi:hypothetical protein
LFCSPRSRSRPLWRKRRRSAGRRGATIAVQKLAPIDDFVNGEIAAGTIPGATTTLISAMAKAHWLGFDLIVLFNDSFFMACMFLISGLFVRESLTRRGAANYLANRAWRLGVPYLVSIFVLMPLAYYPTFLRYHLPAPPTSTSFISGGAR